PGVPHGGVPALGELDAAHPPVAGVGAVADVARGVQLGRRLRHRLLRDPQALGQRADADRALDEVLEQVAVRHPQRGVAARVQPVERALGEREPGELSHHGEVELVVRYRHAPTLQPRLTTKVAQLSLLIWTHRSRGSSPSRTRSSGARSPPSTRRAGRAPGWSTRSGRSGRTAGWSGGSPPARARRRCATSPPPRTSPAPTGGSGTMSPSPSAARTPSPNPRRRSGRGRYWPR